MNEQHKLLTLKIKMTGYSPSDKFKTLTYSRNPTKAMICHFAPSEIASQASGALETFGKGVPSSCIGQLV